jgi:eukaryotic-like serine/threonine-protein kinase
MVCPHCGADAPAPGGRCSSCNAVVTDSSPPTVLSGSLTDTDVTGAHPAVAMTTLGSAGEGGGETVLSADPELTRLGTDSATASPPASVAAGALQPGTSFGPRYHILRVLGAGGMGVVYHAWDEELGVAVALKVIRHEVMSDPVSARDVERRFKRELLLARQVTHKNVVRIHDLGEVEGVKYITMPFIEGDSLSSVIAAKGKLKIGEMLPIARDIAAGLVAAHDAGVVHRDLKPENVMIESDGPAVIMDFGISRSAVSEPEPGGVPQHPPPRGSTAINAALTDGLTMAGAVVGTVGYMSPEQARAEPVDHRSDIYSFGLIVRDLLLGLRRNAGMEAVAELMERMKMAPPSARSVEPEIPETVDRIISRCLHPDPAARYQTTRELLADLTAIDDEGNLIPVPRRFTRKHALAGVVALLLVAGGTWWIAKPPPPVVQPPTMSVLISDFENRAGDAAFAGALEQTLGIALERASFISVYPRPQAEQIAATQLKLNGISVATARLISRREGIRVIITGQVEPYRGGYRVTATAIDPSLEGEAAKPLTSASATAASKGEVLQAVGALAASLRADLGDTASEDEGLPPAETFTAGSIDAMRAYARGQELFNAGKYQEALASLQEATRHDPKLGRAYAAMGAIYVNLKQTDKAKASFEEALKLLERMSEREKYRTRATYYIGVAGNYPKAIENYEALIKEYPADNGAYGNLALAYLRTGKVARARDIAKRGLEIHPRNLRERTNYAAYALYAADFATAAHEAEAVLAENANYEFAYLPLALSRIGEGNLAAAEAAYTKLAAVSETGRSLAVLGLGDLGLFQGLAERAREGLQAGLALDEKLESRGELASKLVAIAEAELAQKRPARAVAAAKRALATSSLVHVAVPAARVLLAAGQDAAVRAVAADLENRLQSESTAYAGALRGELALRQRNFQEAIDQLTGAAKRQDVWLVRYLLGMAYFEAGNHATEALEEWERCYQRRGEAIDLFFADSPTSRYLPPVFYWLGRAREQVGAHGPAAEAYREYAKIRSGALRDPLLANAQQRLTGLK